MGHGERLLPAAALLQDNHELVSSEAHQHVVGAQGCLKSLRDGHQQLITHVVAVGVVHLLEVVEIAEHHHRLTGVAVQAIKGGLQVVAEGASVGQAGERILVGLVAEMLKSC